MNSQRAPPKLSRALNHNLKTHHTANSCKLQSLRKRTANVYPMIGLVGVIPTLEKSVESENDLVGQFRFQLVFTLAESQTFVL